jgi:hypothetical protein
MISYPAGWTLSVLPDASSADAAAAELTASGVAAGDVIVLAGPEARDRMSRLGTSSGIAGRIRRSMQFLTMDQMPDLHVYELALDAGHPLVGVRIDDAERRRAAVGALLRHGGHFINRFGDWATEEIARWRGEMPDVPQHMRR